MKLLRKMLLVLLFLSLVLPVSAAPETEKAKENALPSEMQCPECKKKINLEKELKKIGVDIEELPDGFGEKQFLDFNYKYIYGNERLNRFIKL